MPECVYALASASELLIAVYYQIVLEQFDEDTLHL